MPLYFKDTSKFCRWSAIAPQQRRCTSSVGNWRRPAASGGDQQRPATTGGDRRRPAATGGDRRQRQTAAYGFTVAQWRPAAAEANCGVWLYGGTTATGGDRQRPVTTGGDRRRLVVTDGGIKRRGRSKLRRAALRSHKTARLNAAVAAGSMIFQHCTKHHTV